MAIYALICHFLNSGSSFRIRMEFEESLVLLQQMGYQIACTPGTASYYQQRGYEKITSLSKPTEEVCTASLSTAAKAAAAKLRASVAPDMPALPPPAPDTTAIEVGPLAGRDAGAVLEWIRDKRVDLVINIPEGSSRSDEITSGYLMRRTAVDFGCSLLTNIK